MPQTGELWTTSDVAKYLGVKPGTVSAYRHRGQMPAPVQTLGERTHLWEAATIREWHEHRRPKSDAPPERTDPHEWLVHGERDLYKSEWVRLSKVDVEPPHGSRFEHHVVTMRAAAMTAIIDESGENVGLVWRHRFAPDLWNWELPGGLVDDDEEPIETARREVREELGLVVAEIHHVVSFEPVVGMVRSPHHVFVATGARAASEPTEKNEGAGLEWIALDSIKGRIKAGEISNSGTLVALLHLLAFGIE
ncbi:NUDIX domain-containing protein [Microlunatus speluncae]|uniref:NUDIX domain-containing protein n=1 Tax=Microlunatus speluncae TaxID=2594267 RepID=UPI001FEA410B|nr:NUDIX domain-containing protein [Microlunatus speluncae]